jgi:SAM-dependent methyltransferase
MSDFYALLAQHYDSIFPAEPQIVDFLADQLGDGRSGPAATDPDTGDLERRRIIDAACGTGNYTDALVRRGFDCRGIDASEEMIEVARRSGKRGAFEVRDIEQLRELGPYEARGLFCIGNSLPHLPSRDAVRRFFRDAVQAISYGGRIVVQTVNFARFSGDEETDLPPVERPDVTMRRCYRPGGEPGTVIFHAELETRAGERAAGDTLLLALSREELVDAARSGGFTDISVYGSFHGESYDRSGSFLTVLTATSGDAGSYFG